MQYDLSRVQVMKMKATLKKLNAAVGKFSDSISNFPVGAISIDDFKPTEEKIEATRESLKQLSTQMILFKTKYQCQLDEGETVQDESAIFKKMKDVSMRVILVDKVLRICLESNAIKGILSGVQGDSSMQEQIYLYMKKLFALNNNVLLLQQKIICAYQDQIDLKIECQNALYEHQSFLKKQEEANAKNLEGMTPGMSKGKQKVQATISKINLMKSLITTFIATSGKMLKTHSILLQMLENNSKMITMELASKMMEQAKQKA